MSSRVKYYINEDKGTVVAKMYIVTDEITDEILNRMRKAYANKPKIADFAGSMKYIVNALVPYEELCFVGKAQCNPQEKFNAQKGKDLAHRRMMEKVYTEKERIADLLSDVLYGLSESLEFLAQDYSAAAMHHYDKAADIEVIDYEEDIKPHRYYDVITQLQKGHMNPNKSLEIDNVIPQCQICNQNLYKNDFIFNEFGTPVAVNNANFITKSTDEVQRQMYDLLKKKFGG